MSIGEAVRSEWKLVAKEANGWIFRSTTGWFCVVAPTQFVKLSLKGETYKYLWSDPEAQIIARRVVG